MCVCCFFLKLAVYSGVCQNPLLFKGTSSMANILRNTTPMAKVESVIKLACHRLGLQTSVCPHALWKTLI